MEKLYKDYLPLTFDARKTTHLQRSLATREVLKQTIKENWDRLKKGTLAEANALWQPCIDCLRNGGGHGLGVGYQSPFMKAMETACVRV